MTCGDAGGIASDGNPCTKPAGWGTDEDGGRCRYHAVAATSQEDKRLFLERYAGGENTMADVAAYLGRDPATIWRWRQQDPEFDEACENAKRSSLKRRLTEVEDSVYGQILRGEAAATVVIFWMTNIARQIGSDDWLHVSQVQHDVTGQAASAFEAWMGAVKAVEAEDEAA